MIKQEEDNNITDFVLDNTNASTVTLTDNIINIIDYKNNVKLEFVS